MKQEQAETVALRALEWLVGQDELLPSFLGATGTSGVDLAQGAGDPAVLAAVLDFILASDGSVMAFCDSAGFPYSTPLTARAHLPGGQAMHWT